jgi:hypothetical protein
VSTAQTSQRVVVDSRGPRFGASITAVLLLVDLYLALISPANASSLTFAQRLLQPATLLLIVLFVLFLYGALRGVQNHPYGIFFAKVIKPRLKKTGIPEDAAAPTFAQGVGALVTGIGLVLHLVGVPLALPIAIAAAFIAAFLNAAFAYCLGCEIYLLLRRAGVIRNA